MPVYSDCFPAGPISTGPMLCPTLASVVSYATSKEGLTVNGSS